MGLRIGKRFAAGNNRSVNVSKSGASVSQRGSRGSVGVGKRGARGSIRIAPGISWTWGKR